MELRQSTATAVVIGPFLDDSDGYTPLTSVTVASIDADLYKHSNAHPRTGTGLTITASGGSNDCSHIANGYYSLELTATDVGTLGTLRLTLNYSGALPLWHDFEVVTQNYWDSKYGSDYLQVDAVQVEGSDATDQIRDAVVDDATRIDASALNTLSGHDPGSQLAAQSDVAALNDPTAADIADAVWDEDIVAAHNTGDTAGALLDDLGTPANFKADVSALAIEANVEGHVTTALNAYDPPTKAEMDTAHSTTDGLINTVDGVVDAIKAVTDLLPDAGALTSIAQASALATVDGNVDAILLDTGTDGVLIASGAVDADAIAAAAANKLADHVWRRGNANIEDSSDGDTYDEQSPYGMVAFFTNKVAPNGSNLEVFEADGVTVFYYRTPTTDSGADPITAMSEAT